MTTAALVLITPEPSLDVDGLSALARALDAQGVPVRACHVVGADENTVARVLRDATEAGGLVACLGEGEGREVARHAVARLLGTRLVLSDRALEALAASYAARGRAMPARAEALALVPQGATVIVPAEGGEPGFLVETAGALVAVLPGAAAPAMALLREHVLPRLPGRDAEPVTIVRTLRLAGLEIGEVAASLATALRGVDGVAGRPLEVGGEVWVRLRLRGPTVGAAEARLATFEPALRVALGAAWYGSDDETLETVVGRLLQSRGVTVALAESCTGGLVGHRLTQVPGSSTYFERGFVVYSNAAKQALLGVPDQVLARHGAVSAECAEAMAAGARRAAGTDLGLSVTGIAGPEGGTTTKPVGTVLIALADARAVVSHHYRFDRDREGNKALAATRALDLLRRYCLEVPCR